MLNSKGLWVGVEGGRCGCKNEVNKKLVTYLMVAWELEKD